MRKGYLIRKQNTLLPRQNDIYLWNSVKIALNKTKQILYFMHQNRSTAECRAMANCPRLNQSGTPSKKKKPDLRTLSQKVGGGPDQIPNFVVCEIGTRGGEGSQTLICPNFKSDLRTKGNL